MTALCTVVPLLSLGRRRTGADSIAAFAWGRHRKRVRSRRCRALYEKDVGDALSYRARARSAIAQCATASLRQARAPLSGIEGASDIPECAPGTADRRTIGLFSPLSPPISVSNCKDDATRPASGHSRLAPSHPNHRLNLPTRPIGNAQQPTSARPPIIRQTRYSRKQPHDR